MKTIIIGGVADGTSEADGLQPARRRQKAGAKYSLMDSTYARRL